MATRILAPGGASPHPRNARTAPRRNFLTACALLAGAASLSQLAADNDTLKFAAVLSSDQAGELTEQLFAAVAIARNDRGAA